jgi:hypothetical protein
MLLGVLLGLDYISSVLARSTYEVEVLQQPAAENGRAAMGSCLHDSAGRRHRNDSLVAAGLMIEAIMGYGLL